MSHTTKLESVTISSIPALRAALAELAKNGVRCSLKENATPRAYYSNQAGMGKAPYVIELADAKYDIGLYPDGKGGYTAATDFWGGSVQQQLGVQACSATGAEQAKMGKLFQSYAIHATMEEARKKGYTTRRVKGKDGSEQIVITGV